MAIKNHAFRSNKCVVGLSFAFRFKHLAVNGYLLSLMKLAHSTQTLPIFFPSNQANNATSRNILFKGENRLTCANFMDIYQK